jgi:hypothetical protein
MALEQHPTTRLPEVTVPNTIARTLAGIAPALFCGFLAGCAGPGVTTDGPPIAAPTLRVGDRWVYRVEDGFRVPVVWEEIHEVTAVGTEGIAVRITQRGDSVNTERSERWPAPGQVLRGAVFDDEIRRFAKPLVRYPFPLTPGQTVNQWADNVVEQTGKSGQINRWMHVNGWTKVTTPAGTFDAMQIRVIMHLDDEEFWRYPTQCNYLVWFAPAVGATVREQKDAQYMEKGSDRGMDAMPIRSQHAIQELVSFTPGQS